MTLFQRVVVPVANEEDARATGRSLATHLEPGGQVTVVHVVPDMPGTPDPAPTAALLEEAENLFDAFEEGLGGAGGEVHREALHEPHVAEAILETVEGFDATAVAFTPRGGSRWVRLLAGDVTTPLIEGSRVPIVIFPDPEEAPESP